MIKHTRKRLGLSLLLAAASTGCAGWPSTASNDPSFDTTEERLVEAQKDLDAYHAEKKSSGYMSSIADAFTPEPKVNKAPDPVALGNQPAEIGADVFLTAGAFFESQGQLDKAKSQYERALAAEPNQLFGLVSLARLADRMGNSVEAERLYDQAIAAHPSSGLAHNDKGLFLHRKGNTEFAVASLAQAATLEPNNVRYINNYATVLVEIGQYDQALAQLRRTGGDAEAHYNLGFLLHQNDQNQLAMQHFAEAARLNPQLQQAHAMLAKLGGQTQPAPQNQQARAYQAVEQYQQQQGNVYPSRYQPGGNQPAPVQSQEYIPYGGSQGSVYTANQSTVNQGTMRQLPPVNR